MNFLQEKRNNKALVSNNGKTIYQEIKYIVLGKNVASVASINAMPRWSLRDAASPHQRGPGQNPLKISNFRL